MVHKAGFVNLIGRPNAGKSTLMNALVGERLSIITPKAQTTRHRILGIVNEEEYQIVFSDTPGILEPKYALQSEMMSSVKGALSDADVIIFLIDVSDKNTDFQGVDTTIARMNTPLIIALNKIDLSDEAAVESMVEELKTTYPRADILPISALHGFGTEEIKKRILVHLPESPPYYDKDVLTDRSMRFIASEMVRERIMENYQKEIPYAAQVEIEKYKEEENLVRISAVIYVERKSQKGIIIGHKGEKLKRVGTEARKLLEEFIGTKVFLELYVKVDADWRKKENRLKAYGYKN